MIAYCKIWIACKLAAYDTKKGYQILVRNKNTCKWYLFYCKHPGIIMHMNEYPGHKKCFENKPKTPISSNSTFSAFLGFPKVINILKWYSGSIPLSRLISILTLRAALDSISCNCFVFIFFSYRCDSIDKLKAKLPNLESEISDPAKYRQFYHFTFNYAKNAGQKGLGK